MKKVILAIIFLSFNANATMTEKECEVQAKGVYTLLKMVEDGSYPATEHQLNNLKKAAQLYERGEYCATRSIILNVNQ